jgi:hypothetical protein
MATKQEIVNYLKQGNTPTRKQGEKKFGAGFTQRIAELRTEGFPNIYTNKVVKGNKTNFVYRLGKMTKTMRRASAR